MLLSSVLEKQCLWTTVHPPLLPHRTQVCAALPWRQCKCYLYSSSHQNKITAVLILSVSNSGRSLCKLKSLLSDNVSEKTQFILIRDISCHSEMTEHKELQCVVLALQLEMILNIFSPCSLSWEKATFTSGWWEKQQSESLFCTLYLRSLRHPFQNIWNCVLLLISV